MYNDMIVSIYKSVVISDAFSNLPDGAKLLYYYLIMYANPEGFVDSLSGIFLAYHRTKEELQLLIKNNYVIYFERSRVVVIRHWMFHKNHHISKKELESCASDFRLEKMQLVIQDGKYYLRKELEENKTRFNALSKLNSNDIQNRISSVLNSLTHQEQIELMLLIDQFKDELKDEYM